MAIKWYLENVSILTTGDNEGHSYSQMVGTTK